MTEQGVRPARGRLSPGTKRRFPCVEARVRTFRRGRGREARGRGKKPNTKTKRSLTVCIIDALKKSRAPRHMCPSPAAVRRYPNGALALMVGRPAAAATPFAAEAVTCSKTELEISTTNKHYPRLEGQPQISILLPCPTRVLYTGGRILAWTHRSTKEESIRINQFLRRTAAIVSRAEEVSLPQQSAWRKGGVNTPGKARHGTARRATPLAGFRRTCLGGFLFGPCMRPLGTRALARDSSSL